jgi:hypothetical protein
MILWKLLSLSRTCLAMIPSNDTGAQLLISSPHFETEKMSSRVDETDYDYDEVANHRIQAFTSSF